MGLKYLCKIDKARFIGSDRGLDLPKNKLKKLELIMNQTGEFHWKLVKCLTRNFLEHFFESRISRTKENIKITLFFLHFFLMEREVILLTGKLKMGNREELFFLLKKNFLNGNWNKMFFYSTHFKYSIE